MAKILGKTHNRYVLGADTHSLTLNVNISVTIKVSHLIFSMNIHDIVRERRCLRFFIQSLAFILCYVKKNYDKIVKSFLFYLIK